MMISRIFTRRHELIIYHKNEPVSEADHYHYVCIFSLYYQPPCIWAFTWVSIHFSKSLLARAHMMIYSACNQHIMLNHIISSLNNYGNLSSFCLLSPSLHPAAVFIAIHHRVHSRLLFWHTKFLSIERDYSREVLGREEKINIMNNKKLYFAAIEIECHPSTSFALWWIRYLFTNKQV